MRPELEEFMMGMMMTGTRTDAVITIMLDEKLIDSPKQPQRTLEKWSDKGFINWGVSIYRSWFEDGSCCWPSSTNYPRKETIEHVIRRLADRLYVDEE